MCFPLFRSTRSTPAGLWLGLAIYSYPFDCSSTTHHLQQQRCDSHIFVIHQEVVVALVIVVPSEELFSGQTANNVMIVVPTIFFGPNRQQRCDSHVFVINQEVVVALVIVVATEQGIVFHFWLHLVVLAIVQTASNAVIATSLSYIRKWWLCL